MLKKIAEQIHHLRQTDSLMWHFIVLAIREDNRRAPALVEEPA